MKHENEPKSALVGIYRAISRRKLIATLSLVFVSAAGIWLLWNKPVPAAYQSEVRLVDVPLVSPVMAARSDRASSKFFDQHLLKLIQATGVKFTTKNIEKNFADVALDPGKLILEEAAHVRVYILGDESGYMNALGINIQGVGVVTGNPRLIFPLAQVSVPLRNSGQYSDPETGRLLEEKLGERNDNAPLLPGDFVDLGKLPAGTSLNFFLAVKDHTGKITTYTTIKEQNPDKVQHVVALAVPGTPYLALSFEDMYGGGDHDYGDCVFAVKVSSYNVEALLGKIDPWRRAKQIGMIVAALMIIVLGPGLLQAYILVKKKKKNAALYAQAAGQLESGTPENCLQLLEKGRRSYKNKEAQAQWDAFELAVRKRLDDTLGLANLASRKTELFEDDEPAALKASYACVKMNRADTFEKLFTLWQERSAHENEWLAQQFDQLTDQGKFEAARSMLEREGTLAHSAPKLLARLAWLHHAQSPQSGWQCMGQINEKERNTADVALFQARMMDAEEKFQEAQHFYSLALSDKPCDIFLLNECAEFLRRNGNYKQAYTLWDRALKHYAPEDLWLTCIFWRRVAISAPLPEGMHPPVDGIYSRLLAHLNNRQRTVFLDEQSASELLAASPAIEGCQEVFWLRLLGYLKAGNEGAALCLLNLSRPWAQSWEPHLEMALRHILTYRRNGFVLLDQLEAYVALRATHHAFFKDLIAFLKGDQTARLEVSLNSEDIFAYLFYVAKWHDAARELRSV